MSGQIGGIKWNLDEARIAKKESRFCKGSAVDFDAAVVKTQGKAKEPECFPH